MQVLLAFLLLLGSAQAQDVPPTVLPENMAKLPAPLKALIFREVDIPWWDKEASWQYVEYFDGLKQNVTYDVHDAQFIEEIAMSAMRSYNNISIYNVAEVQPIRALITLKKLRSQKVRAIIMRQFLRRGYYNEKILIESSLPLASFNFCGDSKAVGCKEELNKAQEINLEIENHSQQCEGCIFLVGNPLQILDVRTLTSEYLIATQIHAMFQNIFSALDRSSRIQPRYLKNRGFTNYLFAIRDSLDTLGLLNPHYDLEKSRKKIEEFRRQRRMCWY